MCIMVEACEQGYMLLGKVLILPIWLLHIQILHCII